MSDSAAYVVRNVVSGLLVPTGVRDAVPLTFGSYEEAQHWLIHIDAPIGDFQIERVEGDA